MRDAKPGGSYVRAFAREISDRIQMAHALAGIAAPIYAMLVSTDIAMELSRGVLDADVLAASEGRQKHLREVALEQAELLVVEAMARQERRLNEEAR